LDYDGERHLTARGQMLPRDASHIEFAANRPTETEYVMVLEVDRLGKPTACAFAQRPTRVGRQGGSALEQVIAHELAPVSNLVPTGER
jgi:hypothetical protein